MSSRSRAGAACLVIGPLLGLVAMLITHSVSHHAADQAAAFTAHPTAARLGLGIGALAVVLLAGGLVWLAWMTHERSPGLAFAGGVLGVLGSFSVVADDLVHLSGALIANGHSVTQATSLIGPLYSGGVVAVGPLSELGDLGTILLVVAALRIGAPRWAAAVVIVGVLVEGAGFGIGTRYLAAVGFVLAFVGFAAIVRALLSGQPAVEPAMAAQHV